VSWKSPGYLLGWICRHPVYGWQAIRLPYITVTFPVIKPVSYQRHLCMNNLPRVVTWWWNSSESNLWHCNC